MVSLTKKKQKDFTELNWFEFGEIREKQDRKCYPLWKWIACGKVAQKIAPTI